MPIKKIDLTNFKGKNEKTYELFQTTELKGKNGSGKTLIRDAIAFVFCGTDSYGTRNPTHLISNDQDNLKVSVDTGKALFSRTLTRKGSSTVKLEVAGVATTFNQTQLEEKIGRTDTFLSVLIPGYFFSLTEAKRQEVLADVLPKVDRVTTIEELSGLVLTEDEKNKYGFNRRYDLIASAVSVDRRSYELALNQKRGSVEVYERIEKPSPVEVNHYVQQISDLDSIKQANEKYASHIKAIQAAEAHNAKLEEINEAINKRLIDIDVEIQHHSKQLHNLDLYRVELSDQEFITTAITPLESQLRKEPQEPMLFNIITQDNCSTCGQSVSERHRDSIRMQNEKIKQEYLQVLEEVRFHNKEIQGKISALKLDRADKVKKYLNTVNTNRDIKAKMQLLENEKAVTRLQEKVEVPLHMAAPTPYELAVHLELKEKSRQHDQIVGEYNSKLKNYENAQQQIIKLKEELLDNQKVFERLSKLEETLKTLPSIELKRQSGLFETETLKFNGEVVFVNNVPYNMLSTGEKMAVNLYFSRTISSLWHRSHKIIFLDDADLLSTETYEKVSMKLPESNDIQHIMAYVTEDTEVQISGN
jgi:7,8-dihydro-6-hydroxymethylpterin-pyrophosphokinase